MGMSKAIGIDLGSARCTVAVVQEGEPRLLGEPIPTTIAFDDEGMHVGQEALPIARQNALCFFDTFLRLMGRKFW